LNSAALAAFERQFLVSGHAKQVFLADDGKPLIRKPIRRWFEDTMLKAQIRNFSWHRLRHTFASRLVMAGVSLKGYRS
jgi:site-specific recombinase XerD